MAKEKKDKKEPKKPFDSTEGKKPVRKATDSDPGTNAIGQVNRREIVDELKESYIDYAMSVIVARALPDVRDGLKPVHRKILFAMNELGLGAGAKFRKCAAVVGEVMAKYHPHGDMAIYDSLTRMAQDFNLRYPLVAPQGNFGCFTKDTKVKLTDGRDLSFGGLIKEHQQGKNNFTYTVDESGKIKIAKILNPRKTIENTKIMKVVLDNGEEIKCTLSHKFMLKDGSYKEAQDLQEGESLMPLYFKLSEKESDVNLGGYSMIFQPNLNVWNFSHVLADELNLENNIYQKSKGRIRHHIDFNKLNNSPENIVRLGWKEHWQLHYNLASKRHREDSAYREKIAQGRKNFWANPKNRKEYSERMSLKNSKNWKKSGYREKMRIFLSEMNKKFLADHPERIEAMRKTAKKTMTRLWQIPEYKQLFHEKIVASNKKRETNLTGKVKFLRICKYLSDNNIEITQENYEKVRIEIFGGKNFTMWITGFGKYFENSKNSLLFELNKNHKVVRKEFLSESEDVYDLTIIKTHNFALSAGVFVHNSIDGDGAAASRYTEARLSKLGEEMLADIEMDTVNFMDNYDGTKKEPTVLPSPLPQLLLNGSLGIAVGMATNIPPHNLTELIDAVIYLLDHPKAETPDLFQFIQGPDFPTGGIIYDQKEIISAYSQGKGSIIMRGKADIETKKDESEQIIITEIPYQVLKSELVEAMAELVSEKKVEGIKDIKDLSDREGMRIVIDVKRGYQSQRILNRLYQYTNLQKTFHLNLLALVDGIQPEILSISDVLKYFIKHRTEVITRRTKFELEKCKQRAHILEGLMIALHNIDAVIQTIKKSKDKEEAKINLMKKFKLTELQAVAILEMRLQTLAGLERLKIEEELKAILERIKELLAILKSPEKLKGIIQKELLALKEKFGDKRRTRVVKGKLGEIMEIDLVPLEETMVTLTTGGYIKRINPATYKIQKRGGKGIMGMKTMQDDIVEHFLTANTHDNLLFFTDSGKVFQAQVYEIPEGARVARGRGLVNFLEISQEEKVLSLVTMPKKKSDAEPGNEKYLLMVTKNGTIKKTSLEEFDNVRKSGIIAIKLEKGDLLKKVVKTTGLDDIVLVTKSGAAIRFKEKDIRPMGRAAAGVRGIRLKKGDEVIGVDVVLANTNQTPDGKKIKKYLLVVMENGYGKRTEISQYKVQTRGGSGVKTAKITSKTGGIVLSSILDEDGDEEDLIVISQKGQVIRTGTKSVSLLGRATQGVRIMRLEDGDKVASGACLKE
ncbi:MAG: hypothetical protein A2908_03365 [Candidatus Staskawiczbacteria bacterium RIFCSPLOWO2_01_FULL_38_12b]|uniref:DNA topoisomerase (ATP-hydrolyzing) n=1 Tax=Candidatus Staskawiczbacteria bacterium RIFCSPLOWO2_01_FULL_38_12b TaxID=1802214 RepID=A0A1G2IHP8_9BACT|nr:MAG: hypothetical protein A2908_03365 [Candidatus Staskawiczbacteria bacterium RIFCSPLOWO2_01_FULL_38_12b]QBM02636.1 DNA gyrase subunit A [uncultured archaeon]